jgi:hypothetical protein
MMRCKMDEEFIRQNGLMCEVVRQATMVIAMPMFLALSLFAKPAKWIWNLGVKPEERK